MTNRILVTYASRTGSTAEVAQAIAKTLAEDGAQVDVLPMQEVMLFRVSIALGIFPRGDQRDWSAIRAWAESLKPALGA